MMPARMFRTTCHNVSWLSQARDLRSRKRVPCSCARGPAAVKRFFRSCIACRPQWHRLFQVCHGLQFYAQELRAGPRLLPVPRKFRRLQSQRSLRGRPLRAGCGCGAKGDLGSTASSWKWKLHLSSQLLRKGLVSQRLIPPQDSSLLA